MLLQRGLEIPHLPLDRLGKLQDPAGEQGPVPPQGDLEQCPEKVELNQLSLEQPTTNE